MTLDTDFANALAYPPAKFAGIVVLRMPARSTPADIEVALDALIAAVADESLAGRLLVVDFPRRIREFRPFER